MVCWEFSRDLLDNDAHKRADGASPPAAARAVNGAVCVVLVSAAAHGDGSWRSLGEL